MPPQAIQYQLQRQLYTPQTYTPEGQLAIDLYTGINIPNNIYGIQTVEQLREVTSRNGIRVYQYSVTNQHTLSV